MSWVKLDDRFPEHPKVLEAGEDAAWMFLAGLAYCNRNPANRGFIPTGQVPRLTLKKNPMELAQRLVTCGKPIGKAGLWEEVQGGFLIHDYHDYQPEGASGASGPVTLTPEDRSRVKSEAGRKGGKATQQRAPQVASNLRQNRSNTEAAPKQHRSSPKHPEATGTPQIEDVGTEAAPKHRTEATPKQTEAATTEAAPKHTEADQGRTAAHRSNTEADRSSDHRSSTEAHRSPVPVPVPVPESVHTGARDAQAGAHEGAAQAPRAAPPPPPAESLEQRWARVADVAGFSFPGIIELRREVEAAASKLGQPFDEVFDAAVAAFKGWRETCDQTKRPALSPVAMVRNWAHVWQLLAPRPAAAPPTDGGSSMVPSVEETSRRLAERAARARAAGPVGAAALEALRLQELADREKATA